MSNITQLTTVPADLVGAQNFTTAAPPATSKPSKKPPASPGDAPSSTEQDASESPERLVISEGGKTGDYVYTILDRATGQVLVQIPREEVLRIAARPDYTAGQVIDTTV